jgi:hypothetical protein
MDVHHGLNGNRRILVDRPDHSRIYGERGRPGYVQRPYRYHGHDFARRDYFYHGHGYSRFYHGYEFRGRHLDVYAPGRFYRPAYYGWAYNNKHANQWLTNYVESQNLQTASAAQQEAGEVNGAGGSSDAGGSSGAGGSSDSGGSSVAGGSSDVGGSSDAGGSSVAGGSQTLPPDVQQQVTEEVKGQVALENQEAQRDAQHQDPDPASSGIERTLTDGQRHVFVVGSTLDVTDSTQAECALSDGDVLALTSPPPPDATAADLTVLTSKGGNECRKSSTVTVQLTDLQEMQNRMRELIDQGLQQLQDAHGQGGLPMAPPSGQGQPVPAQYVQIAPPEDPDAGTEIQQQTQQADQAETDVSNEAAQSSTTQPQ